MGYRSDVILAIKDEHLKKFINEECDINVSVQLFTSVDNRVEKDGWTLFHWNCTKWYEDYEEVRIVTEFMSALEEHNDFGFEFHRLGEEPDDYECRNVGESPFGINLVRHLDY